MSSLAITQSDVQKICNLVSDRLGFAFSTQEYPRLKQAISRGLEHCDLTLVTDYWERLETSTISDSVWQQLIKFLGNTESYFFRNKSQFELLRSQILPELIQRRSPEKKLTLWSAGCATGEEAYSLAILLKELIPNIETWQITVFGTDIDTEALAIAAKGEYSDWSLRSQNTAISQDYFTRVAETYRVQPELRQFVQFLPLNLLDTSSLNCLQQIDLILCRHVFIHLERQAITKILAHFKQVLRADGYLMTGHSELYGMASGDFRAKIAAGSLVYQLQLEPPSPSTIVSLPRLQWRSLQLPKPKLHLSDPVFLPDQAI